ncbi:not3 [Nucleospora cyclopteri]
MAPETSKEENKLTPEEYWKQVSQHLSHKKSEECSKAAYDALNFDHMKNEIAKVTEERVKTLTGSEPVILYGRKQLKEEKEQFINSELENSYSTKPLFAALSTNCKNTRQMDTPSFFPKKPLHVLSDPSFFKKFDLDTLFFIFYFFKGTVQQTYAAIRLKSFAWRFHLKYKIWFQRLDEPKLITLEYEKGEFLFFDYETTWNFMKKNDFVFEYCYLEHNDHY